MSVFDPHDDDALEAADDELPAGEVTRHGMKGHGKIAKREQPQKGNWWWWARRASYIGDPLDALYMVHKWQKRLLAKAYAQHPDLLDLAGSVPDCDNIPTPPCPPGTDPERWAKDFHATYSPHRRRLEQINEIALDRVGGTRKANRGTAFHGYHERLVTGDMLHHLSPEIRAGLDVLQHLLRDFQIHATETFTVFDDPNPPAGEKRIPSCGTFDWFTSPKPGYLLFAPDGEVLTSADRIIGDTKGLALDTPIPTPTGWTTMGAIQVGELVFGSDGRPCRVTEKSQVKRIGTYVVEFGRGGEKIVCDSEHLWWVLSGDAGIRKAREQVIGVEELRDTLFGEKSGQRQHRVPVARPLSLPPTELPIDPYLLGCWLGDGSRRDGTITKGRDLFEQLAERGFEFGVEQTHPHSDQCVTRTVKGLTTALHRAGLAGHKMIPDAYLRGSIEQRVDLLRGLMDTDGCWNTARNRAVFSTTDKALAEQVGELCLSLGIKPNRCEQNATGFGLTVRVHLIEFAPLGFNPFSLPRKADQVTFGTGAIAKYRIVRSVEPGPDVETQCIVVDSPNRTYLCGRDMIPTHNSGDQDIQKPSYETQPVTYVRGQPYDFTLTEARRRDGENGLLPWPDGIAPNQHWALIAHVPLSRVEDAGLYWVDVDQGERWARAAEAIRAVCSEAQRTAKKNFYVCDAPVPDPDYLEPVQLIKAEPARLATVTELPVKTLLEACERIEDIDDVYVANASRWSDELGVVARKQAQKIKRGEGDG